MPLRCQEISPGMVSWQYVENIIEALAWFNVILFGLEIKTPRFNKSRLFHLHSLEIRKTCLHCDIQERFLPPKVAKLMEPQDCLLLLWHRC